jgi:hypothetical protein
MHRTPRCTINPERLSQAGQLPPRPRRRWGFAHLFALLLASLLIAPAARAQTDADTRRQELDGQFRQDYDRIVAPPTRTIGSEGYQQTADYLEAEIRKLPNVELKIHEYEVMVPVSKGPATLAVAGGATTTVYPFWPAQVRVNATPEEGVTGRLVYVGKAGFEEIDPGKLQGQIAVIEAGAKHMWTQAPYFGARAVLVLGSDDVTNDDLRSHELSIPIAIPRFYLPASEKALADQLRKNAITAEATLSAKVDWEPRTARNLYAFIPGTTPRPNGWTGNLNPGVLMFSVGYESSGLVPELAKGASQAVQTAAGLNLLRDFASQPTERPVMVFFGGGDSMAMLATRNMFMALSDVPKVWREELDTKRGLRWEMATLDRDLQRVREISADLSKINPEEDRAQVDRIVKIIETDMALEQDTLFRLRVMREERLTDELKAKRTALEDRQVELSKLKYALQTDPKRLPNWSGSGGNINPAEYVQRTIARLEEQREHYERREAVLLERIALFQWLAGRLGMDPDPDDRSNDKRLIEAVVALDLSDRGVRVGPLSYGQFQRTSNITSLQNYRDWFERVRRDTSGNKWFERIAPVVDFEPLTGVRSPQSWLCAPLAIGSELCRAWATPGFSLVTLDDLRAFRDTPADTPQNLNLDAIMPQLDAVRVLMRRAWEDVKFKGPVENKWQRNSFVGQVVSAAPGRPVPDLPRPGFLVTYYFSAGTPKIPKPRKLPYTMGLRKNEVAICDAEGRYRFEGLSKLHGELRQLAIQVYRLEPGTGDITAASDLGRQSADITLYADLNQNLTPRRSLVFNCAEFPLVGLYDPRFLQDLGEVIPLDARRNAEPQRYNVLLGEQLMAGFFEPDMSVYLLFRYGRIGNRLMLLNMEDWRSASGKGVASRDVKNLASGFTLAQMNNIDPLTLVTSQDFHLVDSVRLANYRTAGVTSELLDALHAQAGDQIARAGQSYPVGRGMRLATGINLHDYLGMWQPRHADYMIKESNAAWATEARVYQAAQAMANDVVRAAIFLLLLCVPFAFCMERLLVGSPNIYRQIGGGVVIFSIMTGMLWLFHPAFRISTSPLIIILAFAIIFMSLVVISVVYGRFDTELKKIRSGRGSAQSASFARASVLMSAVTMGIANMRRRKFRTALTSITIVLITFAVLAFTSASRFLDTTTLPTGEAASHPGIMLRQRGFRPMPQIVVNNLKAVLGPQEVVERWWNVNAGDPKDQLHVVHVPQPKETAVASAGSAAPALQVAKPKIFATQAVLGLSPGESRLSPEIAHILGDRAFKRLEDGETNIIYLSRIIAEQLGISQPGAKVLMGGIELEVASIFDAAAFDQRVITLSGESIAPLKYSAGALDAGGRKLSDVNSDALDLDADASASELAGAYDHLSATQFVIVPAEISRKLPNASLRSVALRLDNEDQVKRWSDELSKRFAVALFAGFDDGVKMVAASNLASVSGAGQVAIPLAIAGLIIFNTMMGSIAERKREIHVYTSLGLAPVHVGALFVAEALTYGLIGAVFGYIGGQLVGKLLTAMDWLGGATLNYSGTSAMLTIGLILVIVLLSALVPARLASKIAAPSIDRSWRVPLPKGDEIQAQLPFTINKTAADGALAYLAEFFEAHQEGSIGKFSAGKVEVFTTDAQGRDTRGIKTVIWLTPFDLGVRQHLMLMIHPGEYQDIYEVQVLLQRLSGDDGSWYRMNRTFLTELRKQFLQWRSLSPQRMMEYVEESKRLFATQTPDKVVTTVPGEEVRLG